MTPFRSDRPNTSREPARQQPTSRHPQAAQRRLQWSLALAAGATAVLAGAARLVAEGALRAPLNPGRIAIAIAALTIGVALASLAVSAAWPLRSPSRANHHAARRSVRSRQPGRSQARHGPRATPRAAASRATDPGPW